MVKMPRTKVPPGGDVGCATGLPVHPLCIDAKTGAVVSAVYFDAETGFVFIEDELGRSDKVPGQ
jgi:hypothetical protein